MLDISRGLKHIEFEKDVFFITFFLSFKLDFLPPNAALEEIEWRYA